MYTVPMTWVMAAGAQYRHKAVRAVDKADKVNKAVDKRIIRV
jgi:hypothetical protein